MTQEELDAMMSGDADLDSMDVEESAEETPVESGAIDNITHAPTNHDDAHWPPPAPTDDNKMVHQLDDVTRESEIKAGEIFDIIENISEEMMNGETRSAEVNSVLDANIETFTTLHEKFPNIETFKTLLAQNQEAREKVTTEIEMLQDSSDQIMNVMDIMQYQDIHRQKIERVINVMRALSKYMNTLFSGQKEDSERVSSATHIAGDSDTEDVMGNDDIEALLNSFGSGN